MRLTLRTLLAYLDDMLEPNQAREIGSKLAESSFAAGLVDRIREVMRRRRLGAPDVEGPNASPDANTIAEYLDNTLSPDAVADVERICLESDVNLAEVAAAHQILTLVLGEPAEIPPRTRERMYALGPVSRRAPEAEGAAAAMTAAAAPVPAGERREAFSQTIPDYLRPTPIWRRALPLGIVAAIAVVWGALIWMDPAFFNVFRADEPAARPVGDVAQNGEQQLPAPPAEVEAVPQPRPLPIDGPPAVAEVPRRNGGPVPAAVEPPVPPQNVEPPIAVAPPAAVPEEPQPPEVVAPPLKYESSAGVVLRYQDATSEWFPLPREAVVQAGEWLACPEPFEAEFLVGGGRARVKLFGGTGIRYTAPPEGSDFALEIERGALLVEHLQVADDPAAPPPAAAPRPLVAAIVVRGETWSVALGSPGSRCGIEIVPRQPTGFEQDPGRDGYGGAIYAVSGAVRFADGSGRERTVDLSEGQWLPLGPENRGVAGTPRPLPAPESLGALPAWLDPQAARVSPLVQRARRLFEKEFEEGEALGPSLAPIVSTPEPLVSELAVKCLALAGKHAELAHALARAPHDESRQAAIVGLRTWLGQNPKQGALLREDLERLFPPETVEAVYRLLWGYGVQDAHDPARSAELVGWLDHEELAVRQLAIFHIRNFTGRTLEYLPHNPAAQRRAAAIRWQRHIEKEGSLLSPPAAP
ncbi:MAG: hypothetical protein WD069_07285 [Planctomycetales bacterium]